MVRIHALGAAAPRGQDAAAAGFDLRWLLGLRWGAVAVLALLVGGAAAGLGIDLPLAPLWILIGILAASNLALTSWVRHQPLVTPWTVAGMLAADVTMLSAVLFLTGGPSNPFSLLYLVYVSLGAVSLSRAGGWALLLWSALVYALLFWDYRLVAEIDMAHHGLHLHGMWVAFVVTAVFIVEFVSRLARGLSAKEAQLAEVRERAARGEKLAHVVGLAAGAAHELGTPLSTIAVVARELEKRVPPEARADVVLIREQVERCRTFLQRMATESGQATGESRVWVGLSDWVEAALRPLQGKARVRVEWNTSERAVLGYPLGLIQALRNLVKNALEAGEGEVTLRLIRAPEALIVEVQDRGAGMDAATLARVTEPFFTTKPAGQGLGLGLFLTQTVVERMGGTLRIDSAPDQGTTASLWLPESLLGYSSAHQAPLWSAQPTPDGFHG